MFVHQLPVGAEFGEAGAAGAVEQGVQQRRHGLDVSERGQRVGESATGQLPLAQQRLGEPAA